MGSRHAPAAPKPEPSGEPSFGPVVLGAFVESINGLVAVLDENAVLRTVNSASEKLFGLRPEAMIGRPLFDFVHAGDRQSYIEALDNLRSNKISEIATRFRITGTDLKIRTLSSVTYPYNTGTEQFFVLFGHRNQDQNDLQALVETQSSDLPLGYWRYEIKTKLAFYSRTVSRFLGQGRDFRAVVEDYGLDAIAEEDRDHVRAIYQQAIIDKKPFAFRVKVIAGLGQTRLCQTMGMVELDENGTPVALAGLSYDITDVAQASKAFYESAGALRELFSEISDVIFRIDARGRYLYVSPSVKHVLGYDAAELSEPARNSLEIVHPDDIAEVRKAICAMSEVGDTAALIYRSLHKDGHWLWMESQVRAVLMGPNGYPAEIVSVSRDITARKRAEEELAAALARAEAASATKSRFLANMSHELRTPLNAIIGFSDIIRRELFGPTGSPRYKEYAQLIQDSGSHLLDLINDILDMSKIEAGKSDMRFEPVNLAEIIMTALKLMEPRAQEAKLVLSTDFADEVPFVQADQRALKQILLNLLTNAVKFTPPGGLITVSLQSLSDGVALQVRDTGIGIAPKDLSRVTLPFEQATNDPLLAQAGSGLGLALVQSLVNLHKGTLKIDSEPGEGTVVTLFLPTDPRSRHAA